MFDSLNRASPLMKLDEILYINDVFEHIKQSNSNYYNHLMSLLPDDKKNNLNALFIQIKAELNNKNKVNQL